MTSWWASLHVHVYKQTSKIRNIHASLTSHACSFYPPILSAHSVDFLDVAHLLRKVHKQCCQSTEMMWHRRFLQQNGSLVSRLENLHCSFHHYFFRVKYNKKTPVDPCQRALVRSGQELVQLYFLQWWAWQVSHDTVATYIHDLKSAETASWLGFNVK